MINLAETVTNRAKFKSPTNRRLWDNAHLSCNKIKINPKYPLFLMTWWKVQYHMDNRDRREQT
jgi:hypothetical protein